MRRLGGLVSALLALWLLVACLCALLPFFDYGKQLNRSWTSGTWRVLLLKGTWTPDVTLQFVSQLSASESSGTNYARQTLTGQAIAVDTGAHVANHSANNAVFGSVGSPLTSSDVRYAVVYQFGTNDADSVLLCYFDLGQQAFTSVVFTVAWNGGASSGTVFQGT